MRKRALTPVDIPSQVTRGRTLTMNLIAYKQSNSWSRYTPPSINLTWKKLSSDYLWHSNDSTADNHKHFVRKEISSIVSAYHKVNFEMWRELEVRFDL